MRVLLFLVLAASLAGAQESNSRKRAKQLFDEGMKEYDARHYKQAIESYRQAYELLPVPLLLFDIGQAYRLDGSPQKAVEYYERYVDVEPSGKGAQEARQWIASLKERLSDPKFRAEEEARRRAEAEARAQAERQAEEARARQRAEAEERTRARAARTAAEAARAAEAAKAGRAQEQKRLRARKWAGVGLLALGAAALATGGAMSALTAQASNDVQKAAASGGDFTPDVRARQQAGTTYQNAGIALYAIGGASAAVGTALLVLGLRQARRERAQVVPLVGSQVLGLTVSEVF